MTSVRVYVCVCVVLGYKCQSSESWHRYVCVCVVVVGGGY